MARDFRCPGMDPLHQLVSSSTSSSDHSRKASKPLMEKRRRARINASLNQLKSLVLDAFKKDSARYSKLEKSDILELTVKHLKSVQRQQLSVAMATDPSVATKFQNGYTECAKEVSRYLSSIDSVDEAVRMRLLSHLSMCMQRVSSPSDHPLHPPHHQQAHHYATHQQPLFVHIPGSMHAQPPAAPDVYAKHNVPPSGSPLEGALPGSRSAPYTSLELSAALLHGHSRDHTQDTADFYHKQAVCAKELSPALEDTHSGVSSMSLPVKIEPHDLDLENVSSSVQDSSGNPMKKELYSMDRIDRDSEKVWRPW